jgi:hypothetical protein
MEEAEMTRQTVRIGLAAIAAFYAVLVGLWAVDYFPLRKFYAQMEVKEALVERLGYDRAWASEEYEAASAYQQAYALSHPGIMETEGKLALYQSILLWGTIAIGVGGGVLYLTRGRGGRTTEEAGQ